MGNLKLDTKQSIIGRFKNIEDNQDNIQNVISKKKGTYDKDNKNYSVIEFIQNVMGETVKGIIGLIIFGIVFTFLPYIAYSFGWNIVSIGMIIIQVLTMYGIGSLTGEKKQYNTLTMIGLTYPVWVIVWLVGRAIPVKYRKSQKEKELGHKVSTILLFQDSLTTQAILDEKYGNTDKVVDGLEYKNAKNSVKKLMILEALNRYVKVEYDKDSLLIESIKDEIVGKSNVLSGRNIDSIYKNILHNLNRGIKLPNGYVTRLYNILTSNRGGISVTSEFEYLGKDSMEKLMIKERELSSEDLQYLIDNVLHLDYLYDKNYKYLQQNYDKVIQQENERKTNLEYYRKHKDDYHKKYEEVKDKLTITNMENKWEERDNETKEIMKQLNEQQKSIESKIKS